MVENINEKIYVRGRAILTLKNDKGEIINEIDEYNTWTKCSSNFNSISDNGYSYSKVALLRKQTGLVKPFIDIPSPPPASDYWTFYRNTAQTGPSVDLVTQEGNISNWNGTTYWSFYGTTTASTFFVGVYYGIFLSIGMKIKYTLDRIICGEYEKSNSNTEYDRLYCPSINSIIRFSSPFSMTSTDTLTWTYYIYFSSNKYDNMKY